MSFELHERTHIERELVKIVRRELRHTVDALTASAANAAGEQAVHESRKSVKKVRAVAAFLKQAGAKPPRKDRWRLKVAARALSRLRDSAAIVETFDRVRHRYPKQLSERTYNALRRALVDSRDREHERAQRDGAVGKAVKRLRATRRSAKHWSPPSIEVSDIGAIVGASYRRSRVAMKRARATQRSATLHDWRKELKTLWYQLRLAKPLTAGVPPLVAGLERLETGLGEDHNLVILAATLRGCRDVRPMRGSIRQIGRLAVRMRQSLRRRVFARARRLFVRTPKVFARWLRRSVRPRSRRTAAA
jgi:CHAD domain-containing protein